MKSLKKKKKYVKPNITKVKLDAKCAVLGYCKNNSFTGPNSFNCGIPVANCFTSGS